MTQKHRIGWGRRGVHNIIGGVNFISIFHSFTWIVHFMFYLLCKEIFYFMWREKNGEERVRERRPFFSGWSILWLYNSLQRTEVFKKCKVILYFLWRVKWGEGSESVFYLHYRIMSSWVFCNHVFSHFLFHQLYLLLHSFLSFFYLLIIYTNSLFSTVPFSIIFSPRN